MSRNGSGVYSLPAGNPVTTGTTISSTWANNTLNDMASALTASIAYDGQTVPVANLPMGGNIHTGVGNATARTNYPSAGQVQDGTLTYLTGVSGTDTITAIGPIGMASYVVGQTFRFIAASNVTTAGSFTVGRTYVIVSVGTTDFTLIGASANTVGVVFVATGVGTGTGTASTGNISTSVTLNINSIGAKPVTRLNGAPLAIGDIPAGGLMSVAYDGTNFQIQSSIGVTSFSAGATGLTPVAATNGAVTLAGVLGKLNGGTGALTATITQVSRATNVSTITTSGTHGFVTGDYVTVAAVTNTGFNGNFTITGTPTTTSFTYAQVGSTVVATADTGTVTDLSYVNLATNVTGTLYPNFGGTGLTTVPTGNLLVGNATSAMTSITPGSNGQSLIVTAGGSVTAGSFIPGATYTITSVGTTSFTSLGAASNTVGVVFTCNTAPQSGTGTATPNTFSTGSSISSGSVLTYNWNGLTTNTSLEFKDIPSWVKRITLMMVDLSTNGTANFLVQLGTGSTPTYTTTGYGGRVVLYSAGSTAAMSAGFLVTQARANADLMQGTMTLTNQTGNTWVETSAVTASNNNAGAWATGSVALSAQLTAIKITTAGAGTDAFDSGSVNILFE